MNIYIKMLAVSSSVLLLSISAMISVIIYLTYHAKDDTLQLDEMYHPIFTSDPEN